MNIDMGQVHEVFFEESFEGLIVMESGLLNLQAGVLDAEQINAIFRAAHSIKGGSGTFGFLEVSEFTHVLETLLDEMRAGRRAVSADARAVLLKSVDVLRDMLSAARDGRPLDMDRVEKQRSALQEILTRPSYPPGGSEETLGLATEVGTVTSCGWQVEFRPHAGMLRSGNDPLRIVQELAAMGHLQVACDLSGLPTLDDLVPVDSYLAWTLRLEGPIGRQHVAAAFDSVDGEADIRISPLTSTPGTAFCPTTRLGPTGLCDTEPPVAAPPPAAADHANPVEQQESGHAVAVVGNSIRVDTHKIDHLINLVGELVITQSMLWTLGRTFDEGRLEQLQHALNQLERHTLELQECVMQIRMLPIRFLFQRLPRLVHDLGRKLGKKVDLVVDGEQTEVDKTVIEKLGDPLVHLVRNCIDHGIEPPKERTEAGKSDSAVLRLSAVQQAGSVIIEVRDDGRGLVRERILAKAVERGLLASDAEPSDEEVHQFIFEPGFSTADRVSEISGRGVGMDVVRRNIEELDGTIEIDSEPGRGSAFRICLPLTLAILDGQKVRIGTELYVIPLTSIIESVEFHDSMVDRVHGDLETLTWREALVPVIRLRDILGTGRADDDGPDGGIMVVAEAEGRRYGLVVDELLGQQQIVIKSLEANYRKVAGVAGATILGDGAVALILDIAGVVRLVRDGDPRPPLTAAIGV